MPGIGATNLHQKHCNRIFSFSFFGRRIMPVFYLLCYLPYMLATVNIIRYGSNRILLIAFATASVPTLHAIFVNMANVRIFAYAKLCTIFDKSALMQMQLKTTWDLFLPSGA